MLITEELQLSDFSGGRRSVGSDEERGKAEVADMQATVFRGRGVAQKAAQKAARQAEQEWRRQATMYRNQQLHVVGRACCEAGEQQLELAAAEGPRDEGTEEVPAGKGPQIGWRR